MTLQIEEGKFYRDERGDKVGPMRRHVSGRYPWRADTPQYGRIFQDDGVNLQPELGYNLVAEWIDEPIPAPNPEVALAEFNKVLYGDAAPRPKIGLASLLPDVEYDALTEPDDPEPLTKRALLEKAIEAVADRGLNYGAPEDNFQRIANLWNAHLENRGLRSDWALTPVDVANMMALMKIARLEHQPSHRDSWVDLAGYSACGAEIACKDA